MNQVTVENDNLNSNLDIIYSEDTKSEGDEYKKNIERKVFEKKNDAYKNTLKQKHFNSRPTVTHRRINMGKR
jgi:hypothetical protein